MEVVCAVKPIKLPKVNALPDPVENLLVKQMTTFHYRWSNGPFNNLIHNSTTFVSLYLVFFVQQ